MYKILFDYGTEGFKFHDNSIKYLTINKAVQVALGLNYGRPFLIVKIIEWQAEER